MSILYPTRLIAEKFMRYEHLDLPFPRRGVHLVTGDNGSGKSALLEAIVYGLTGRSVRTQSRAFTPMGKGGKVVVSVDETINGKFKRAHGVKRTTGNRRDPMHPSLGSPTTFLNGHIFSHTTLAGFSGESDLERKRLIEALIGLPSFDVTAKQARDDLRELEGKLYKCEQKKLHLVGALEELQRTTAGKPVAPTARLRRELDLVRQRLEDQDARVAKRLRLVNAADQVVQVARDAVAKLRVYEGHVPETCPTCKQPWAVRATHQEGARKLAQAKQTLDRAREDLAMLSDGWEKAKARGRTLEAEEARLEGQLKAASSLASASETKKRVRVLAADLERLEGILGALAEKRAVAETVATVFAPGGVRATILAGALATLEAYTNQELRALQTAFRVRLGMNGERISFSVEGAGHEHYESCSPGERRRLDIPLMLAMSKLADTAAGSAPRWGFYAFDEILDVVDPEGVEAIAERLTLLGEKACVLVISHNPAVREQFPSAQHWHVVKEKGKSRVEVEA